MKEVLPVLFSPTSKVRGGQAGRLFFTEATEVFQDDFIHGIYSFIA